MDAASRVSVRRYVMVSWAGSTPDHGVPADNPFFPYADAKLAADQHLRSTDLDWTILGPGTLTDEPARDTISTEPPFGRVSRGTVARVVLGALSTPETVQRFVPFSDGTIPIVIALRGNAV
jgi:uncharacterized protein YbjT (DUF2867 family)